METLQAVFDFFGSPLFKLMVRMFLLYLFILWISTVIWTYVDAKKRGGAALTWSAFNLVFPFMGLLVYLLLRPKETIEEAELNALEYEFKKALLGDEVRFCPACGKKIEKDFQICPYCLKKLKKKCSNCDRLLNLDWHVCPYCRQEQ